MLMQDYLEQDRKKIHYVFIILSLKICECFGVSARLGLYCIRPGADRESMSSHRLCTFSLNIFFLKTIAAAQRLLPENLTLFLKEYVSHPQCLEMKVLNAPAPEHT